MIFAVPAVGAVEQRSFYGSIQLSGMGCFGDPAPVELDPDTTEINVVTPIVGDVLLDSSGRPVAQVTEAGDIGFATVEFRARGVDCTLVTGRGAWTTAPIPVQIDYLVAIPTPPKRRPRSDCGGGSSTGLGIQDLTARHASCSTARAVARGWRRRGCVSATDPGGPRSTRCISHSFVCRARAPSNSQTIPVRCTRRAAVIKFDYAIA
jgi:hypothetical protein